MERKTSEKSIHIPKNKIKDSLIERPWYVYILECANGVFYTGITNDLQARFNAHVAGKGAKFTRANKPMRILASAQFPNRSVASKVEYQVKQKSKGRKVSFLNDLSRDHLGEVQTQTDNDDQPIFMSELDYDPPRHRPIP